MLSRAYELLKDQIQSKSSPVEYSSGLLREQKVVNSGESVIYILVQYNIIFMIMVPEDVKKQDSSTYLMS